MHKYKKMLFRLYKGPLLILVLALISTLLFGLLIPKLLSGFQLFSGITESSSAVAPWVFITLLIGSIVYFVFKSLELWNWYKKKSEVCHNCGGIVVYKHGKHGFYWSCLACSSTRMD